MSSQPNFVFILCDQLRRDHTGFGGNPIVQTPNLNALAARSRNFSRAYCNSPSCGPSRNAIMTGRMPSANGSWTNAISLDQDANTFVRVLRKSGYRTGLIGKSHLQDCIDRRPSKDDSNMLDLTKLELIKRPPKGEGRAVERDYAQNAPQWDRFERHWLHNAERVVMPEDYYGFGHVELTLNHDDRPSGHHRDHLEAQGVDTSSIGGPANALAQSDLWSQAWKSNCSLPHYSTNFVADRTIEFIQSAAKDDVPFFITASFPDPHHPFAVPEPYHSMYDRAQIPLPDTFFDDHADGLPHLKRLVAERGKDARGPFTFCPSEAQYKEAIALEFGLVTLLDEGIGRILAQLDASNLTDNTYIIFCADHGDLGGDHGLLLKFAAHYHGLLNVPLLIAGPSIQPAATDALAGLLDIGRTVLELADCQPYIGMQGESLVPVLHKENAKTVRDAILVEEDYQADFLDNGHDLSVRTLITTSHRLTIYQGSEDGQLFDLTNDPQEKADLWRDPAVETLKTQLLLSLIQQLVAHRDLSRYPLSN